MQCYTRSACWSNDGTEVQGLEKAELHLLGKASTVIEAGSEKHCKRDVPQLSE